MKRLILLAIVIAAFVLRFYQLGSNPPFLNWDEAAWGYNAYSIGIDGKDEFGRFLPIDYLESFGDYKPPVYAYLDVIPVKIFGLNSFAVRFPSAFLGTLTVLVIYFLVKRIFNNSSKKETYALISSFILAISPWHIMLSRAAFEANVATFFIVYAVWLFLGAIQNKKWYLILSAIFFVLSVYTFNTARVVSPVLVVILSLIFIKNLWRIKREVILAAVVGIILVLPTVKFLLSPQAQLRYNEVNIFSDINIVKNLNQEVINDGNSKIADILHNRRLAFSILYLQHYFDHFNPQYLFITGDNNPEFSIQTVGQMYLWDLPFFLLGVLFLFKKKEDNWWVIPTVLLVGIIPAAVARETPHALRTEVSIIGFAILVAYGMVVVYDFLQNLHWPKNFKRSVFVIAGILLLVNISYFLYEYSFNYSKQYSELWEYGYKDMMVYINENQNSYQHIVTTGLLGRPYIYILFYTKTLPQEYRKTAIINREVYGFVHVLGFGKYQFVDNINQSKYTKNTLFIVSSDSVPKNAKVQKVFKNLDGSPSLVAYTL